MSDGLLVANDTPSNVKAETVAAFLPQIFGRMNQYTKELSLGPLQELTLGVENGTWHIARRGDVFLAVLGKGRDAVPLNLVAQIAAELSSQSI
jgi:predicted regulator of Ras-like GTPase activity (Roadblock/LC7/MglB family)